jgi:hypothetical protein
MTTTPGRMRLAGAAILVGLIALAVVGGGAVRARQRASAQVSGQDERLLVGTERLYSSLADADATATNTFLEAGLEPAARRQAYLSDLATASSQLTTVAAGTGTSTAAVKALGVINAQLPLYTGMVEASRADNLLGYPVGAAYLSESSTLMQAQILPAAGQLYQIEAQRLNDAFASGASAIDLAAVLVFAALALALLIIAQAFVARRTNRLLNLWMLAASVVLVALGVWTVVALAAQAANLNQARDRGSDPIQLTSSAEILLSRAQVDENLALVARGSEPQHLDDFAVVRSALGPSTGGSGLLGEVESYPGSNASDVRNAYTAYLQAHQSVVDAENNGQFTKAVSLATGEAPGDELPAAAAVIDALNQDIQSSQASFAAKAAAASRDLRALDAGLVALVVAAVFTLLGLEQRINEYR